MLIVMLLGSNQHEQCVGGKISNVTAISPKFSTSRMRAKVTYSLNANVCNHRLWHKCFIHFGCLVSYYDILAPYPMY